MLYEVRGELKSDILSLEEKMNGKFKRVDARFNQVDAQFNELRADIKEIKSEFKSMHALVHRQTLLMEEQNNRNRIVLDGYASLFDR